MESVTCKDDISTLVENEIRGGALKIRNTTIAFKGSGNVLYCDKNVDLSNSKIMINGSDSVVVLGGGYHLNLTLYHESVFALGKDCYTNGMLSAIASERRNILIGNECLLSFGVWIRTADPHIVYDLTSGRRINPSEDVLVGDHVWIGQSALVLKNTVIGSGSIVGAAALVAGKTIPSNTSWGGNPARQLKCGIGWDRSCVNSYRSSDTDRVEFCDPFQYDYSSQDRCKEIGIKELSQTLHQMSSAKDKCE